MAVAVVEEEHTQMGTIIIQANILVEIHEVETVLHCSSGYDYPRSRTCSLSRPRYLNALPLHSLSLTSLQKFCVSWHHITIY